MKILFIILTISFQTIVAFSQEFSLPYKFSDAPGFSSMTNNINLKAADEIELLNEKVIEFAYDAEDKLFEYLYIHTISYVNSEDAISRNNKIYIPVNDMSAIVTLDCRVILPNNEIRQLEKAAVIEGLNENEQKVYFFAVSGAELGSCIEYYYLVKRPPQLAGLYFTMQGSYPIAKSVFKIISPDNLHFATKSLNGYANFVTDTSLADRNYLIAETSNITVIPDEHFANIDGNKMKVIFHLQNNTSTGKRNMYNYGKASQNVYEALSQTPSKAIQKEIDNILKLSISKYAPDTERKIFAIEQYVKSKYQYIDNEDERLSNLEFVVKNRAFNDLGATRLFYQLFILIDANLEIVLTTNRFDIKFDPTFDSWIFLDTYLFYFPSVNKFLCPNAMDFRLGLVPYGYMANNALFIKKTSVGGLETGIGKVKEISELPAELSRSDISIDANMSPDLDSVKVDCKQTYTGYYAQAIQPVFNYIAPGKLEEFKESLVKQIIENISIIKITIENAGVENLMAEPLVIKSTFSSSQLFDKAGNKLLIRIGELIGPQTELYQESDRVLPVENSFNRVYNREIVFTVPDGYILKNTEKLNMSVKPFENKGDGAGFISSFLIDGNKLTIKIHEYYQQVLFPKEDYLAFRDVVNASADFNKVVILLEQLPK